MVESHSGDCVSAWNDIAIIGLMMVFIEILLLPLDVANIHGKGGKINMNTFWIISFIIIFIFSLVIIPLMINIYELANTR